MHSSLIPPPPAFRGRGRIAVALSRPAWTEHMSSHRPVLLDEALAGLAVGQAAVRPRVFVDATYGRGGHSGAILAALRPSDRLHALDRDAEACAHAFQQHAGNPAFRIHRRNFAALADWARAEGLVGRIDGLLLDLGVSSPQLDTPARGFSFAADGPLDMRMDVDGGESAADWLAHAAEADIADVLWRYGEERNSRRIARRIVEARSETPLTRTAQLAALIAAVPGPRSHKIHPATRSFQAIRIHINGELAALDAALSAVPALLAPGGRLAVISFHSLEDRVVKRYIREHSTAVRDGETLTPPLRRVGRQFPSAAEIAANPRARSAVLRVAERLSDG